MTGYSAYWIGQIAQRYNAQGPAGMQNRQRTTSRRAAAPLSAEVQEELRRALAGLAPEEDRWSGRTVAARSRAIAAGCTSSGLGLIPGIVFRGRATRQPMRTAQSVHLQATEHLLAYLRQRRLQ